MSSENISLIISLLGVILPVFFSFLGTSLVGLLAQPGTIQWKKNVLKLGFGLLAAIADIFTYHHSVGDLSLFTGPLSGILTLLLVFVVSAFEQWIDYLKEHVGVIEGGKLRLYVPGKRDTGEDPPINDAPTESVTASSPIYEATTQKIKTAHLSNQEPTNLQFRVPGDPRWTTYGKAIGLDHTGEVFERQLL